MVISRRPIVHYEALRRQNYDRQVSEIMAAKTSYILFATPAELLEAAAPIEVEQPTSLTSETPLTEQIEATSKVTEEVSDTEPTGNGIRSTDASEARADEISATETAEGAASVTPTATQNLAVEELQPQTSLTLATDATVLPSEANSIAEVSAKPEASAKTVTEPKPVRPNGKTHPENMTGLGLSLDSIFGEEKQAAAHAQSKYFKDSK